MNLRNRLMLLSTVLLGAAMALWGYVQLNELEALLYRQQEKGLRSIAETLSTYYQHFPTGKGLTALDNALSDQLREDATLARIDLLSVGGGAVDYISGAGRASFDWSYELINSILRNASSRSVPLEIEGSPAIALVHALPSSENGFETKNRICVCVIAYTSSFDEIISEAQALLVYSSAGLLVLILAVLAFSYGWLVGSPLKAIVSAMDQFQRGLYGKRIITKRRDELAQVASHFNSMAEEIERVLARNEELRARQEERIREVTHRLGELQMQISQMQKLSAMGFLAANLAHDFGTPLHSIAGMAGLLLESAALSAEDKRKLELIIQQAERLSAVILNIRRATRLPEMRPKPLEAAKLFEDTLPLVEPMLRSAGITLKTDIAEDCPAFFGDRYRLQTALLNLIQNAVEASMAGGLISVTAESGLNGSMLLIKVEDTGRGIPDDVLSRVCEPFFTTHDHEPLRGLGLAIVQDVVKSHGGRMEIESKPGRGTVVTLYLPASSGGSFSPSSSP